LLSKQSCKQSCKQSSEQSSEQLCNGYSVTESVTLQIWELLDLHLVF
jgi:hypothetical protein